MISLVGAFAAIYLIWGSTYLAIAVAVQTMPPMLMAGSRFVLAGLVLLSVLLVRGRFSASPRQWRDNSIIGAFMLLGGNGLVVWAEQQIPSGITTLVISLNPIFVVLAEWLIAAGVWKLGSSGGASARGDSTEKMASGFSKANRWTWLGLVLGFLGLGVLVGPALGAEDATRLEPMRVLGLIMACISWTIGTFATRLVSKPIDPFCGAAIQMLAGGVWLALFGWIIGEPAHLQFSAISVASWWAWGYLVVAGSLVAFTTFVWLTKQCSPTLVSTYAYVNPVVAVFLGWLVLNEPVSPRIFAGATIIVVGVALITLSKQRR